MPAKPRLVQPAPNRVLVTVGGRKTNAAMGRVREYLDPSEVKRLAKAAKKNRNGVRDALMIYMAERHGYRANELVELKRSAINLERHTLHVTRSKGGINTTHSLDSHEVPALGQLFKDAPESPCWFRLSCSSAHAPYACGYRVANEGRNAFEIQHYMGHTSLEMTGSTALLPRAGFGDW
jgi:integrase